MGQSADILIVGGGVIGLTTAYFLARDGLKVEVLDKGDLGAEASWAGAGIIPPGNPDRAGTAYDKLRATSSRMFPEFTRELRALTGIDNGYRQCGGLEFLDECDQDSLRAWPPGSRAGMRSRAAHRHAPSPSFAASAHRMTAVRQAGNRRPAGLASAR